MQNIKLGVQLYTLRKDLQQQDTFPPVFRRVKDMGAQTVQLSALGKYDSKRMGELCRELSLDVCATHSDFSRIQNDLDRLAQEHQDFDCPQIGIGMLPSSYDKKKLDDIRAFIEVLNKTGERLKQYNMGIAYHNHWFEFHKFDGQPMLDIMIAETEPYVEFILDTYWVKVGGYDPCDYIDKLKGRISVLHLKDYKKRFGFFPAIKAIGDGGLDFQAIMQHAQAAGVKAAVVELDYAKNPYDSLARSLKHLRTIYPA